MAEIFSKKYRGTLKEAVTRVMALPIPKMTHRALQRIDRRRREKILRVNPGVNPGSVTKDYSCPRCRYSKRDAHEHKEIIV